MIYELLAAERQPDGRYSVSFTYAPLLWQPATGEVWTVEVSAADFLSYTRFRRRVLDSVGIVLAVWPPFGWYATSPPNKVTPRQWDEIIHKALTTSQTSAA
jgi:hypothetical protein